MAKEEDEKITRKLCRGKDQNPVRESVTEHAHY